MSKRGALLKLAIGIVVSSFVQVAAAQTPAPTSFQPRDWAGRPVARTCKTSVSDLSGLHAALIEHERAKVGFGLKASSGWFYGNRLRNASLKLKDESIASILDRMRQNLRELSVEGPTAILVYDAGLQGRDAMICAWLITKEGVRAAETVKMRTSNEASVGRLAHYAQNTLGVTAIQVTRAPTPRDQPREKGQAVPLLSLREVAAPLKSVSDLLLPPSIRALLIEQRIQRLLILPVADISTVPFYALPIGDKTLLDMATVVVLADTDALFDHTTSERPIEQRGSKLIIGNPDSSADAWKWSALDGAAMEATEVNRLASRMHGSLLLGQDASKGDVLRLLREGGSYSLIYFATHGIADAADPIGGSFLLLSRGRLLSKEIASLTLGAAPFVVMSACQSGLGKVFEGGMFGLARAWRKAGAAQIVMSLWDVDDEGTGRLMVEFMKSVLDGERPEAALRRAMLIARDDWGFAPGLWSGFAMFGFASR